MTLTAHTICRAAAIVLMALAVPQTAFGQPAAGGPPEQYIVILKDRRAAAPDVAALGGRVDSRTEETMVVTVPRAAVPALVEHASVHYVQRVVVGHERRGVSGSPAEAEDRAAATAKAPGDVTSDAVPPTWKSGKYEYDPAGNIIHIGTSDLPDGDGKVSTFVYDSVGRLIRVNVAGSGRSKRSRHTSTTASVT